LTNERILWKDKWFYKNHIVFGDIKIREGINYAVLNRVFVPSSNVKNMAIYCLNESPQALRSAGFEY